MHALITADTVGGVWTYVRELVTGLVRRGVRVTLVSFGEIPSPSQMEWMNDLYVLDFRPTGFRLEWMQEAPQDIALSTEYLLSAIREVKPDIVHLNQYRYGAMHIDAPKVVVAHSDVVSWWQSVHGHEPPDDAWSRWYRDTVTHGLAGADVVVVPSQWMLDQICSYYLRPKHTQVIYNGRTPTLFNPHITKEDSALSVGRIWDGGKQLSLLTQIEATIPICIAGSEQHPDTTEHNTILGEQRSGVHFKGQLTQAQLRHLYARAGIYIATSQYEPFGLAPLEAALSRCAILANEIPSFRELWGDAACYFEHNNAENLQTRLSQLATDRELRIQYANRGYRRALERFTSTRMVDEYLGLYRTLVRMEAQAA
jgi:glycosyltransferase involved in cell wall biosynthesis